MILEIIGEVIKFLMAILLLGPIVVVTLIVIISTIKQKFIDWFGSKHKNSNVNVRKAYVMKLDDEEVLKNVALNEYDKDICVEAVERIYDKSYLEEIAKSNNFRVSRAAKRRIEELQ